MNRPGIEVGFARIMPTAMATSQDFWNRVCRPALLPEFLVYVFRSTQTNFKPRMIGSDDRRWSNSQNCVAGSRPPRPDSR
jgi:hypothetical protein